MSDKDNSASRHDLDRWNWNLENNKFIPNLLNAYRKFPTSVPVRNRLQSVENIMTSAFLARDDFSELAPDNMSMYHQYVPNFRSSYGSDISRYGSELIALENADDITNVWGTRHIPRDFFLTTSGYKHLEMLFGGTYGGDGAHQSAVLDTVVFFRVLLDYLHIKNLMIPSCVSGSTAIHNADGERWIVPDIFVMSEEIIPTSYHHDPNPFPFSNNSYFLAIEVQLTNYNILTEKLSRYQALNRDPSVPYQIYPIFVLRDSELEKHHKEIVSLERSIGVELDRGEYLSKVDRTLNLVAKMLNGVLPPKLRREPYKFYNLFYLGTDASIIQPKTPSEITVAAMWWPGIDENGKVIYSWPPLGTYRSYILNLLNGFDSDSLPKGPRPYIIHVPKEEIL